MNTTSDIKSYYAATDIYKDSMLHKKANYLKQFSPNYYKSDLDIDPSYDEIFGYSSPFDTESDFQAGDYSIITTPLSLNSGSPDMTSSDNIDPKITGLLKIMDNDPKLRGKFRVSSIYRQGAVTAQGRPSWHGKGLAADIVATSGNFEELEKLMMENAQLVSYCQKHGLGILDEYTKEGQKRPTGSTGPHMHIGPDKLAKVDFQKLLKKYGYA